ncbi:MAG: hypothetical protein LPK02_01730, partial [Rhodobacterales bacterium]|nr:hypothetical protein [Rhodobacterales bacterium]MDX5411751.1 hypothetical protein [Rhodobacterales bacterium]
MPEKVEATSDANGLITVELFTGRYVATVQTSSGAIRFVVGVPAAQTAVLFDLIDQYPAVTPTVLSQVQDLRDEVIAAAEAVSGGTNGGTGGTSDYTQLTNVPTAFPPEAHTHSVSDISDFPTLGTAAAQNVGAFATAAQGGRADSAVQPGDLAAVATSGAYADLTGRPTLGTAAAQNVTAFATAA